MSRPRTLLNPYARKIDLLFKPEDFDRLSQAVDLIWAKDDPAPDDVIASCREDVEVIVTGRWSFGDVSDFPKLKAILETSGGFPQPDQLDYEACFSRGIRVLSCAPAFGPTVAEMGLGLALSVARRITWNDADFRRGEGHWSHKEFRGEFSIFGLQAGFIGFGSLGRCLKPLLEPFGCPIQVYDPWMTDAYLATQGVTPVDIDTLLSTSRLIFVLATPTAENRAFLDRAKLELIKPDAAFLLLSRSHVVDFDVLTEMLRDGRFLAGIDVYPEEPLPVDHPIRSVPNTVFSTHRAGAIQEAFHNIGRMVTNDVEAIAQGLPPREMQAADPAYIDRRGIARKP